jgi:dUTP pyrophosphatase
LIKFFLTRDVAAPAREDGNAGFDFFVPKFNEAFKATCAKEAESNPKAGCYFKVDENGKEYIDLPAGNRVCIPSGVKSYLSLSYPLLSYGLQMDLYVENKSGVATKYGLDVGAAEIDPSYKGEIHLSLTNNSPDDYKIYPDMKITQLVPRVYVTDEARIYKEGDISEEEFWEGFQYDNRGEGGFGSTGERPNV